MVLEAPKVGSIVIYEENGERTMHRVTFAQVNPPDHENPFPTLSIETEKVVLELTNGEAT